MIYVDKQYIHAARKSELLQHERSMDHLRRQVAYLSKAVAWELEQHQDRLKELQRVEEMLTGDNELATKVTPQPQLILTPSKSSDWSKFHEYNHRTFQNQLVELLQ